MSQPIPPPPPHAPGGHYHMVITEYLDLQSTQFRLPATELLLFVSVGLVLINALSEIPNRDEIVSQQLIYYNKKGHFQILFYCLNTVLNVCLLLATADAEILRSPLLKTKSRRTLGPFTFIFSKSSPYSSTALVLAEAVSLRNKIGHPVHSQII